jgi:selenocysteine lyase/cysteine desulfurase
MWNEIRELFPIHKQCVYLNNAGVTPPSIRVVQALESFHRLHASHGWPKAGRVAAEAGARSKAILAELLRCPASSIALLHNTSEGMNVVAQGLRWNPGEAVLGMDREYPANVYPWWNLESRGVRFVRIEPSHSEEDLAGLERALSEDVRVVAISCVNWLSGWVMDLRALGEVCRRRGVLLVVDAAQALGVVPLDPQAAGIAALAASAWKWLLGPVGLGVFYCSPELLPRLDPVFAGTDTVVEADRYLPYKFVAKPDASRFEFSTPNLNDWVYLRASLELLREIGFERVRERILYLCGLLHEGLARQGYLIRGSSRAGPQSGIVSFGRDGFDAESAVRRLAAHQIIVRERDGMLRVSPHIYNNEEDLQRLIQAL